MYIDKIMSKGAYYKMKKLVNKRPIDINVETINRCPLSCCFCCNRIYERPLKVMSLKLFSKICRDYSNIGGGAIGIGAMQSDFLADPNLMKRIRILKRYQGKFYIYSTTPLISLCKYTDAEVQEILETFNLLQISVEGLTREDYQRMAGVDAFSVFQQQIDRIYQIIKKNKLKISIQLYFRTYDINKMKQNSYYKKLVYKFQLRNIRNEFFSWFGSIQQEDLPAGAKLIEKDNSESFKNCTNPNVTLAIVPDGKVVGCGCIDWNATIVIGDMNKQTISEVWNSKEAKLFQKAFEKNEKPNICQECALYTEFEKSISMKKLLLYKVKDGLFYNTPELQQNFNIKLKECMFRIYK